MQKLANWVKMVSIAKIMKSKLVNCKKYQKIPLKYHIVITEIEGDKISGIAS